MHFIHRVLGENWTGENWTRLHALVHHLSRSLGENWTHLRK